ncbi:MAG: hypothetical protein CM1200mP40_17980 [Gammaproteobacteria bacterium]|nr:MAG: hypothetical protein CM1200mP40_17980 [Gammaproteobacteria bacterium]
MILQEGIEGIFGLLKLAEIKSKMPQCVKEGEEIEVKIVSSIAKSGISLSVKAIEIDDEKVSVKEHKNQDASDVSPELSVI